jgi:hypothetical protein
MTYKNTTALLLLKQLLVEATALMYTKLYLVTEPISLGI